MRHIFLSPHMDDAILSAGNHILTLIKGKKQVSVITVFTGFGTRPISWDTQKYLLKSGFFRLRSFERARHAEDIRAMDALHVPYTHMDLIDGGFRKNTDNTFLYPTHTHLFSGTIARKDMHLIRTVKKTLSPLIKHSDILYAPLGIGNHADHIIVNRVAHTLPNKTYYWLDQPYAQEANTNQQHGYTEAFRVPHQKKKESIIGYYQSQIRQLYPNGIPPIDEVFFEKKSAY